MAWLWQAVMLHSVIWGVQGCVVVDGQVHIEMKGRGVAGMHRVMVGRQHLNMYGSSVCTNKRPRRALIPSEPESCNPN